MHCLVNLARAWRLGFGFPFLKWSVEIYISPVRWYIYIFLFALVYTAVHIQLNYIDKNTALLQHFQNQIHVYQNRRKR